MLGVAHLAEFLFEVLPAWLVIGLAVLLGLAVWMLLIGAERRIARAWRQAAGELGLRYIVAHRGWRSTPEGRVRTRIGPALEGEVDGLMVRLDSPHGDDGNPGAQTRCTVHIDADTPTITTRARLDTHPALVTGDPDFDARVGVSGPPARTLAVLDAPMRERLRRDVMARDLELIDGFLTASVARRLARPKPLVELVRGQLELAAALELPDPDAARTRLARLASQDPVAEVRTLAERLRH